MSMKWHNLIKNKCPQCGKDFAKIPLSPLTSIFNCPCGFAISKEKFSELSIKIYADKNRNNNWAEDYLNKVKTNEELLNDK